MPPEYQVARLLVDPALHARLAESFEDGARLSFNMAPPFLPGRGTALDPFGWTAERRAERALLHGYEALADRVLVMLTADTLATAVALLGEVASVRGFGPVKAGAMEAYADRAAIAERQLADRATRAPA